MDRYLVRKAEQHSLFFDIENSDCGKCKFLADCQYYYGKCPNSVGDKDGSQI